MVIPWSAWRRIRMTTWVHVKINEERRTGSAGVMHRQPPHACGITTSREAPVQSAWVDYRSVATGEDQIRAGRRSLPGRADSRKRRASSLDHGTTLRLRCFGVVTNSATLRGTNSLRIALVRADLRTMDDGPDSRTMQ